MGWYVNTGSNNPVVNHIGMTRARTNIKHCLSRRPGSGSASSMDKRTGVIYDTLQFTICDNNNANAVTNASLNILRAATGCISIGIAQVRI